MARTLLLAGPSIAAHPQVLDNVYQIHDRSSADLQMLDRLAAGLVQLPSCTYDVVLLLTDADGTTRESHELLGRDVMNKVAGALKAGGLLKSQDGVFGAAGGPEKTEAILAGLIDGADGMMKPEQVESVSIPLKLRKKMNGANGANGTVPLNVNGKREQAPPVQPPQPAGVGFVDFSDDLDAEIITGDDDDLVDEDDLITEEDMARPFVQPPECRPKAGKRRRACKDCTCGMKEKLEAEDVAKRATADKTLNTMKLGADDLTEVDFTVQGKVGSCGNCALGDAFRCDGCPYIGLPAFKPGEEVRLLNNDIQL
ncbi:electron carrier [Paraphaeosphaeria minitans]|uniref:Anamorsin family protein n=1 Tax=Paraphaeosphaeria minitans TaxID=565426 RepID=A0A9P6GQG5_9PLEO|nr:anamorsin family protein [Paraphaeosphaeria minitans]